MSEIIINPTSGSMGVEIQGVDLSTELSDGVFSEIRKTFFEHGLIFFRNQELTPFISAPIEPDAGLIIISDMYLTVDFFVYNFNPAAHCFIE